MAVDLAQAPLEQLQVANFVWDSGTLAWVKETQSGGGGGGGAVTVANGADVVAGTTTDSAVVSDSSGTLSAKLRGLVKIFANVWSSAHSAIQTYSVTGFAFPPYDYMSLTSASTTDTWTYKTGGSGGSTVATVTITYTDSTKATISTVVRT